MLEGHMVALETKAGELRLKLKQCHNPVRMDPKAVQEDELSGRR